MKKEGRKALFSQLKPVICKPEDVLTVAGRLAALQPEALRRDPPGRFDTPGDAQGIGYRYRQVAGIPLRKRGCFLPVQPLSGEAKGQQRPAHIMP